MCREAFDLKRDDAFESVRDDAVGFVGVDFVRYVREGMWGGASEGPEIGHWHDQRGCDVGISDDTLFCRGSRRMGTASQEKERRETR